MVKIASSVRQYYIVYGAHKTGSVSVCLMRMQVVAVITRTLIGHSTEIKINVRSSSVNLV